MKYLAGIPCLHGAVHTLEAISSAQGAEILLIDNNADSDVKEVIKNANARTVIVNLENIYVNPAWNQIINNFLESDNDVLLLMNSDIILPKNWATALDDFYANFPTGIPFGLQTLNKLEAGQSAGSEAQQVDYSIMGICIILTKEQANKIYPIPDYLTVWYGDNWIYEGLRRLRYKTYLLKYFVIYHALSQNVSRENVDFLTTKDKENWNKYAERDLSALKWLRV